MLNRPRIIPGLLFCIYEGNKIMSKKKLPLDIFTYSDHKLLLYDLFILWQERVRRLTFRKFSRLAGFSAPNYLKLIIDGKRNISPEGLRKLLHFFEFNKRESYYFENLVLMNQAQTHTQKNFYYHKLGKTPGYTLMRKGDVRIFDYYAHWYYPAIRELVSLNEFSANPDWIAQQLTPPITAHEAKKAFKALCDLGMVTKEDGRWILKDIVVSTGPQINSLVVMNYHKEMIDKAKASLENTAREERNISSLTVGISKETYEKMVHEIYSFQQRLLELANADYHKEQVYQVNFQLFPLTKKEREVIS